MQREQLLRLGPGRCANLGEMPVVDRARQIQSEFGSEKTLRLIAEMKTLNGKFSDGRRDFEG